MAGAATAINRPPATARAGQARGNRVRRVTGRVLAGIAVLAIAIGIGLRFTAIDRKVFWDDEIYSAFAICGETEDQVNAKVAAAQRAVDLQLLLEPPLVPATAGATIRTLAIQEPQHAPPFFLLEHWWVKAVGATIAHMRFLSALLSLLALPAMYWLCWELFASRRAGLIGVAFVALSPVQLAYAQEVREYGLWTAALLALTAALVRAQRVWTLRSWALYAVLLLTALYIYPLSAVVAVAQLAFVAARTLSNPRRLLLPLAAAAVAFAAFAPWLAVIVESRAQIGRSMAVILQNRTPALQTLRHFLSLFRLDFLDFDRSDAVLLNALLSLAVVPLVAYATWIFCRRYQSAIWGPVVALMIAALVPTVLPDLLGTGSRTSQTRYFLPLFLAFDVALTALFCGQLMPGGRRATSWTVLLIGVFAARMMTGVTAAHAQTWWNKFDERSIIVAGAINAQPHPLLVSDSYAVWVLSVGRYLRPDVRLALSPRCYLCADQSPRPPRVAHDSDSQVFLLGPSHALRAEFGSTNARCIDIRGSCPGTLLSLWPATPGATH